MRSEHSLKRISMSFSDFEVSKIHALVQDFPANTEVSVAKIQGSDNYFYGAKNLGNETIELDNSTAIFEIGSITKVLTSSVLASVAKDEIISIEDDINPYFDFEFRRNQQISFQSLATHTSGLPSLPKGMLWTAIFNSSNPYKDCDIPSLERYLKSQLKLSKSKNISYSNLGVGLLSVALSRASNLNYHALMQRYVFDYYHMPETSISTYVGNSRVVKGLDKRGNEAKTWDFGYIEGAGAVLSSTKDLSNYIQANFNPGNDCLNFQRRVRVAEDSQSMALGWFVVDDTNGDRNLYFHNGGTPGFTSAILMDVERKFAYIVLSNISALHVRKGHRVDQLIDELLINEYLDT